MRTKLALAGLSVGVAAAVLPVSHASAFCWQAYYDLTGQCSPCTSVGNAYNNVNNRVGGGLPDLTANCLA
jgi:hypothetical protein